MSLSYWNKQMRPYTDHDFPNLKEFARIKNAPLSILDLETTGFLSAVNFGITEIGILTFFPDGRVMQASSLINPENEISYSASKVTGIYARHVKHLPNWAALWGEALHHIAMHHWVSGFNTNQFDLPGIRRENLRYFNLETTFDKKVDIRSIWCGLSGSAKGRLTDVANAMGYTPGGAHRAMADVISTAYVAEALAHKLGLGILSHAFGAMAPGAAAAAGRKLTVANASSTSDISATTHVTAEVTAGDPVDCASLATKPGVDAPSAVITMVRPDHACNDSLDAAKPLKQKILDDIASVGFSGPASLSSRLGVSEYTVGQVVGELLQDGVLSPLSVLQPEVQSWMEQHLNLAIDRVWIPGSKENKKLKPLLVELTARPGSPTQLNYIQLRAALLLRSQASAFAPSF